MYNLMGTAAREDDFKQYFDGSAEKPSNNDLFENEVLYMKGYAASRTQSVLRQLTLAGYRRPADGPQISDGGVINALTGAPGGLAPASVATLFGERLSNTTAQAAAGKPLPISLGGLVLLINGFPAPLLYVSPTQVNFQIPTQILPGTVPVTVFFNGALGNTVSVDVSAY
ncbi:MAG: hypothetical protein HY238_25615 [Acidobacteria bacterium]|nr:hypothetical protein [Acidobacteriota bacterium]